MNPWASVKKMPAEVWVIFGATLINRAGTMVLPFLAIYITRRLGFSESKAGIVLVAYGLGALITSPLSGRLVDRIGAHWVMKVSLLLSGILLLVLSMAQQYWIILMVTFTWGLVNEAYRPANLAITSELVQPDLRKSAIVLNRLAVNVGMSIGPAIGGFLAARSFQLLFATDAITSFIAGAVLFVLLRQSPRDQIHERTVAHGPEHRMRELFRDRRLLYLLIAILPVVVVFFQSGSPMALYIVEVLGKPESDYGLLLTINTIMIIFFELPLNEATARWPRRLTLSLGALLVGVGMGGLLLVRGFCGAALTFSVMTIGEMIFIPASADYLVGMAPEGRKGVYSGLYNMLFSFAFLIAMFSGTQVLQRFGSNTLWISAFALGLISTLMLLKINNEPAHV